jgi:hypothetical protein
MNDENLFLELYKHKFVKLKLWDGTVLVRSDEELYWDEVKHPGKFLSRFPFPHNTNVPDLAGLQESYRRDVAEVARMVEAIKLRYGLMNSDIESTNSTNIVTIEVKKPWLAALLCSFLGPFGMFYFGWRPATTSLMIFGGAQIFFTKYLVKICEPPPWMLLSLIFIWAYTGWRHAKGWNIQPTGWIKELNYFASFGSGVLSTLYLIWFNVLISIPVAFAFKIIRVRDFYTAEEAPTQDILLFGFLVGFVWFLVGLVWFWLGRKFLLSRYSRHGLGAAFLRK